MTLCIYLFVFMITCVVELCFEHLVLLTMNPTSIPSTSSREQMPRPVPSPMTKQLLASWSNFVLVVAQLELIRSSGVLVSMCALIQHSYAVPGSNPWTWTLLVLALTLGTITSWIWPSDNVDVVHDESYPLMVLSLGINCSDQIIITEVESTWTEISWGDCKLYSAVVLEVASCQRSSIHTWMSLPWLLLLFTLSSKSPHTEKKTSK